LLFIYIDVFLRFMSNNHIKFDKVTFEFDGRRVVDAFDELVEGGEHLALMGESGAGKSTLLNSVVGLTTPSSGRVVVAGMEVSPSNISRIREATAWIPQELNLPYSGVEEVLTAPYALRVNRHLTYSKRSALALFERVGMDASLYDKRLEMLSGGEKQRLILISALMLNKRILLLDEPTSALDSLSRDRLVDFLKSLEGTTLMAITHDAEFAGSMDRVLKLEKLSD
jgi:ABC-type multidrug transport system ATPase subunit